MIQHPGQTLSIYGIGGAVKIPHQRGLSPKTFCLDSGNLEFSRLTHVFTGEDFLGSYVTYRPYAEEAISGATNSTTALSTTDVEVSDCDSADLTDTTLQNSEEVVAVKSNCSAETGSSVIQETEPSLAQSSVYKSPDHFRVYPKAGELKCTKY
jgi:hypothetical protein